MGVEASGSGEDQGGRNADPLLERVSPKELEVIELVAAGLSDRVIARRLFVSIVTVRRRATSFRVKVGAQTRAEAVAIAITRGWFRHRIGEHEH
jgi:LuxR family maltose regulon positive regulatory protein